MLRPTRTTHDRRGTIALTTSAAIATCALAGVLAACGGGGQDEGYVAVERPASGGTAVAPTGEMTFVPLEGRVRETPPPHAPPHSPPHSLPHSPPVEENRARPSAAGAGSPTPPPPAEGADSARTSTSSPSATPAPASTSPSSAPTLLPPPPVGPAQLTMGEPVREPTDERWCEKVTLAFRNTGGTPVRSGEVTFGTHIIDTLGIDWATIESKVPLPVPIAPGARREETWTVCVEEWRVPWGMRVETRGVAVEWA